MMSRGMAFDPHLIATKFTAKIDRNGPVPTHQPHLGPCWLWTGTWRNKGYGRIKIEGRPVFVHRIAWELAYGPIPFGLSRGHHTHVCHHCDNPACVRPEHMFLGSIEVNTADKVAKGRQARGDAITRNRSTANGDQHWTRVRPERVVRGDAHPRRKNPERWEHLKGGRDCDKQYPEQPPTDLRRAHGENHGQAKMTADGVRRLRTRRLDGATFSQLSDEFGISVSAVHAILSGRTWNHVT